MTVEAIEGGIIAQGIALKDFRLDLDEYVRCRADVIGEEGWELIEDDMTGDELSDDRDTHVTWSHDLTGIKPGTYTFEVVLVLADGSEKELSPACENRLIIHERGG